MFKRGGSGAMYSRQITALNKGFLQLESSIMYKQSSHPIVENKKKSFRL